MGWVRFFLGESRSRLYPHMHAKYGRDPMAGLKKVSFKFIIGYKLYNKLLPIINHSYVIVLPIIYTIILLKSVCLSAFANCRSQFLLDRLGRCLKLFVSSESISCHEFASQFGLAIFLYAKNIKNLGEIGRVVVCLFQ